MRRSSIVIASIVATVICAVPLRAQNCKDPWITAALKAIGKGTAADTGTNGLCNVNRYHAGHWNNQGELNDLVKQSFVCNDPWIGEIYAEPAMHFSRPNGSGASGECNPSLYGGGHWSSYDDLRTKVLAYKAAASAPPPPPPPPPSGPNCKDPWITAALKAVGRGTPSDTGQSGLCSPNRYHAGHWNNQGELNDLVKQSFLCNDPWIGEVYAEPVMGFSKPQGSGTSGDCNAALYNGGRWNSYDDLRAKIIAVKKGSAAPPTPAAPPAPTVPLAPGPVVQMLHEFAPGNPAAMFVVDDRRNGWHFLPATVKVTDAGGGVEMITLPDGSVLRGDASTLQLQTGGRIIAAGVGQLLAAGDGTYRPNASALMTQDPSALVKLVARLLPKPAAPPPPPVAAGPNCQNPLITAALRAAGKGTAADSGTSGLCNPNRYHAGKWNNTPELNDLVKQSFLCDDPWIGEVYAEPAMGFAKPAGSGSAGECSPKLYGGSWNGYDDLRTKILTYKGKISRIAQTAVDIKVVPQSLVLARGESGTITISATPRTNGIVSRIPLRITGIPGIQLETDTFDIAAASSRAIKVTATNDAPLNAQVSLTVWADTTAAPQIASANKPTVSISFKPNATAAQTAPKCSDPWISAALAANHQWSSSDAGTSGLCNPNRYHGGKWSNQGELNDLVKQSFLCDDPWIGEIYAEQAMGYSKPKGNGATGECSPNLYGGRWSSYDALRAKVLAYKFPPKPAPASKPAAPPAPAPARALDFTLTVNDKATPAQVLVRVGQTVNLHPYAVGVGAGETAQGNVMLQVKVASDNPAVHVESDSTAFPMRMKTAFVYGSEPVASISGIANGSANVTMTVTAPDGTTHSIVVPVKVGSGASQVVTTVGSGPAPPPAPVDIAPPPDVPTSGSPLLPQPSMPISDISSAVDAVQGAYAGISGLGDALTESISEGDEGDMQRQFAKAYDALIQDLHNPASFESAWNGDVNSIDPAVFAAMIDGTDRQYANPRFNPPIEQSATLGNPFMAQPIIIVQLVDPDSGLEQYHPGQPLPWRQYNTIERVVQQMRVARYAQNMLNVTTVLNNLGNAIQQKIDNLPPGADLVPQIKALSTGCALVGVANSMANAAVVLMPNQVTSLYTVINDHTRKDGDPPTDIKQGSRADVKVYIGTGSPGGVIMTPYGAAKFIVGRIFKTKKVQTWLSKLPDEKKEEAEIIAEVVTRVQKKVEAAWNRVNGLPPVAAWFKANVASTYTIKPFKNRPVEVDSAEVLQMKSLSDRLIKIGSTPTGKRTSKFYIDAISPGLGGYYFGLKFDLMKDLLASSSTRLQRRADVNVVGSPNGKAQGQLCTVTTNGITETGTYDSQGHCIPVH